MSTAPSDPAVTTATAVMQPLNVDSLKTFELTSSTSDDAEWVGQFFAYGGSGADQSTAIYFAMPPGKRLGRHTDTAEETQYILSGSGELLLDEGARPVRAGDVFVLKQGTAHDLRNTGSDDLAIIAFFCAPQVEQHWTSEVWEPGDQRVTGTPNR
ncbi:MAG TPA: cupin domain-containing protein [Solirubrobacteraceae bacterium]|jgi:quercetin dioxygenase-like cupin family protein